MLDDMRQRRRHENQSLWCLQLTGVAWNSAYWNLAIAWILLQTKTGSCVMSRKQEAECSCRKLIIQRLVSLCDTMQQASINNISPPRMRMIIQSIKIHLNLKGKTEKTWILSKNGTDYSVFCIKAWGTIHFSQTFCVYIETLGKQATNQKKIQRWNITWKKRIWGV